MVKDNKQNYKYTEEFGYIPKDWEINTFDKCFNFLQTNTYSREELTMEGNIKNIHYGDILITYPTILSSKDINTYLVGSLEFKNYRYCRNGDIIIADTAEDNTVGKAVEIQNITDKEKVIAGLHTMLCRPRKENVFSNKFLGYFINSSTYHNQLIPLITGIKVSSISKTGIKTTSIIIPPLPEQKKIAEVLSDVDSLIERTQQLIDKKKNLKIATMQKLLTPKKDWIVKSLGEIGDITGAGIDKKINSKESPIRLVNFLDVYHNDFIYSNMLNHWVTAKKEKIQKCKVKKGDIFFTPSSEMRWDVALSAVAIEDIEDAVYSYHLVRLRLKEKFDLKFSTYMFNTRAFLKQAETLCEGSGKRYVITLPKFREMEVCYPKSIVEQEKISTILFDIDSEIEKLEQELSKYKDLKIGMMQELLTGKIRLIKENIEEDNVIYISTKQQANDEFKDAIIISVITDEFGEEKYPLGAFRRQKLSYLFKRYNDIPIDDYLKKAMGPYNPKIKYKGGENIALKNNYVKKIGSGLVSSNKIEDAKKYYKKYYSTNSLDWLVKLFKYMKNEYLEVLTTVDYTIIELVKQKKEITIENIKKYISSDKEWLPKLKKDYFSDSNILKAMNESKKLFNSF